MAITCIELTSTCSGTDRSVAHSFRPFLSKKRTKPASQQRSVATNVVQKVCLSLVTFFGKKVTLIPDKEEKEKTD